MKKFISIAAICLCCVFASAQDISLNGPWRLSAAGKDYLVQVPQTFNLIFSLDDYAGEVLYSRLLPISSDMKGRSVRICFEAVYRDAVVFVNGKKAGEHINKGYTPFSFDITKLLDFTKANLVEVRVSNAYTDKALPYMRSFDWSNDGGIIRGVKLHLSGKQTIRYVHVTPQVNLADSTGKAHFAVRLYNEKDSKIAGHLTIISRKDGRKIYDSDLQLVRKHSDKEFKLEVELGKVHLWHFDAPNLYDFIFTIRGEDALGDHFGFRSFKVEGRSFVLNGEKVRLPGIEDMPGSHPDFGMAEPKPFIYETAILMKHLNTAITRFHWPQDDVMLDAMDELGILATEQIPWWQQPAPALGEELRSNAREQLEEMIEAHYNHPCIFAWGLANEVWGVHDDLKWLDSISKKLDSSRPTIAFSHEIYKDFENNPSCVLDIPTWNEYTGAWHGPVREDLPDRLTQIGKALPDRPLLISEAGLCEPVFAGGDGRRVDDMMYHIKEWQKCDFIPGYIYFCVQDYRTQMGEEGYGKWRIRRHGVTKSDLTPKPSYFILRQMMSPLEITKVLPANSSKSGDSLAGQVVVDASDHDARIGLKVKNTIPSYTLRGYWIEYFDEDGILRSCPLPDLKPGDTYETVLIKINPTYSFKVMRPGGFAVIEY